MQLGFRFSIDSRELSALSYQLFFYFYFSGWGLTEWQALSRLFSVVSVDLGVDSVY